jgi:hypothetical protein
MSSAFETPGYLLTCKCGHELRVGSGQAGAAVACPACGGIVVFPSLSRLRHLPILAGLVESRWATGLCWPYLAALVAFFTAVTIVAYVLGFPWLIALFADVAIISIIVAALLPRPVLYGVVLAVVVLVLGTVATCQLASAREHARWNQCQNNLKELGLGFVASKQYDPSAAPNIYDWAAEHGYRLPDPADQR